MTTAETEIGNIKTDYAVKLEVASDIASINT
jgi:hypothetical protein